MDSTTDAPRRRRGPRLPDLAVTDEERVRLQRWARRRTSSQALAMRCRIVLACAQGASNTEVAERLGVSRPTVTTWRSRFLAHRLEGLDLAAARETYVDAFSAALFGARLNGDVGMPEVAAAVRAARKIRKRRLDPA